MTVSSIISIAVVAVLYANQIGDYEDRIGEYEDTIADMNNTIKTQRQTIDLLVQGMYEGTFLKEILERAAYVEQGEEMLVHFVIGRDELEALREHGIDIAPAGNVTTTKFQNA